MKGIFIYLSIVKRHPLGSKRILLIANMDEMDYNEWYNYELDHE